MDDAYDWIPPADDQQAADELQVERRVLDRYGHRRTADAGRCVRVT